MIIVVILFCMFSFMIYTLVKNAQSLKREKIANEKISEINDNNFIREMRSFGGDYPFIADILEFGTYRDIREKLGNSNKFGLAMLALRVADRKEKKANETFIKINKELEKMNRKCI